MSTTDTRGVPSDLDSWSWIHWLGIVLSLGIAAINVFVGYTEGRTPFFVVGASFLLGVVLFVSRLWSPVLYLLGVLHVGILGIFWVLSGLQFRTLGVINGILSVGVALIALYLFFQEGAEPDR